MDRLLQEDLDNGHLHLFWSIRQVPSCQDSVHVVLVMFSRIHIYYIRKDGEALGLSALLVRSS